MGGRESVMGRRAKSPRAKSDATKNEGARIHDLEKRLAEAQEPQTAAAAIRRVISSSPRDIQPVFDTIARNAVRPCRRNAG